MSRMNTSIETISVRDAALFVGCTPRTIHNWLKHGKLTRYEQCGHPRVDRAELAPVIARSSAPANSQAEQAKAAA